MVVEEGALGQFSGKQVEGLEEVLVDEALFQETELLAGGLRGLLLDGSDLSNNALS